MPSRPLAVVQFGRPDGPLDTDYIDTSGWGTIAARVVTYTGTWAPASSSETTMSARPARIKAGLLQPDPTTLGGSPPIVIGAALLRMTNVPVPDAGRVMAQLGTVPGSERPPPAFVQQGIGVGLQTPDGLAGVMAFHQDTAQGYSLLLWLGDSQVNAATVDRPDPDRGLIGLAWDEGVVVATVNGLPVTNPLDLPVDASELEPFVLHYRLGLTADSIGVAWAALTESVPVAPPAPVSSVTPTAVGWSLTAATRDSRTRGEIPASSWTWRWRLNDTSEVSWNRDTPGGLRLRPHATLAQVRHRGSIVHTGPAGPSNRSSDVDAETPDTWRAGDRITQLQGRILYPTSTLAWTDQPLEVVLGDLVGDCNELAGGDTFVRVDPAIAGPTISLTVNVRDNVRKAIDDAVTAAGGEWWIDAGDVLRWSATGRGGERPFLADHGGTVLSVTEAVDPGRHGTALWVTGQNGTAVYRQTADIATRAEGRVDLVVSDPDQTRPDTLSARADRMLEDAAAMTPAWTASLRPDAWSPSKLAPGDVARLVSAPLGVDAWLRVFEIAVTCTADSPDPVSVEVTFGAPRPDFVRGLAADRRRIATLERVGAP